MRALSLVLESNSIPDFFRLLRAEGHPAIWYFIIYVGWLLIKSPIVLNIASLIIVITAVIIFLFRSPFSLLQKGLFIFGGLPLYEYSVMSRNYGIGMLLLFVFFSLYPDRFKKPILIGTAVFLLAQTNLICIIISFAIFLSIAAEYFFNRKRIDVPDFYANRIIIGLVLMLGGFILAVIQIYPPDPATVVTQNKTFDISTIIKACMIVLWSPGNFFHNGFGMESIRTVSLIIWLTLLYFIRRPFILVMLFISILGIGFTFIEIFRGEYRHQGFIYILFICAFWIEKENLIELKKNLLFYLREGFIYILLFFQIYAAIDIISMDIQYQISSSRSFSNFIKKNSEYNNAIIVGEPDYYLESLSYYISNPLYFPRENRFGKVVSFTTANKRKLSLAELLNSARKLKTRFDKPILIELGHNISASDPNFKFEFSYGKVFEYNPRTYESFVTSTRKVAEFKDAYGDENYTIYELR